MFQLKVLDKGLITLCILLTLTGSVVSFCKPSEECWPTEQEISAFEATLSSSDGSDCLPDVPTFTSADKQGKLMANDWYDDQPKVLTPFLLVNLRTFVQEGDAYFVILAREPSGMFNTKVAIQFDMKSVNISVIKMFKRLSSLLLIISLQLVLCQLDMNFRFDSFPYLKIS